MFSITFTFCEPNDPLRLWNTFKNFMIEYFIRRMPPRRAEQAAFAHVEKIISQCGKTLANYNFPSLDGVAENVEVYAQLHLMLNALFLHLLMLIL